MNSCNNQRKFKRPPSPAEYKDLGLMIKLLKVNAYKIRLHKPLSKSIYNQIRAAIPESVMSSRRIYDAIGHHVHSIRYLLRMKAGDSRFNIYGQREGKVSASDEKNAVMQLNKHHAKFMIYRQRKLDLVNSKITAKS